MSFFQYDVMAVPRAELWAMLGSLPRRLTVMQFGAASWWTTTQPPANFDVIFAKALPIMESWSAQIRMWGEENSNRIDLSEDSGQVKNIEFRIDIRHISIPFLELICAFARSSNCVLVSAHSMGVIEPLRDDLLQHLARSTGANNVWDWMSGMKQLVNDSGRQRLFLSHSSMDKDFVSRLAVDFQSRRVPVWFDSWELQVGDSLSSKISEAISGSGWLVVVLSNNSIKSDWVRKELNAALALELQRRNVFVLPVLIETCDVPLFLLDRVYADFRNSYENGLDSLLRSVIEAR